MLLKQNSEWRRTNCNSIKEKLGHCSLIIKTHQTFQSQSKSVKTIFVFRDQSGTRCNFWRQLSMKQQVSKTCQSSYPELRRISSIRHASTVDATKPMWHPWFCQVLITVTHCCQEFLNSWLTNFQGFKIVLLDSFSQPLNAYIFHQCVVGPRALSFWHSLLCVNAFAHSTLLLLPSSSSWLLCSLVCALVLFQCLRTSVVSAVVSGRTDPEPRLWPKVESSPSASQAPLQLLRLELQ